MILFSVKNDNVKINTSKELNKEYVKKIILVLCSYLKDNLPEDQFKEIILATYFLGMNGISLNQNIPNSFFVLCENEEDVECQIESLRKILNDENLTEENLNNYFKGLFKDDYTLFFDPGITNTVSLLAYSIYYFIQKYLYGDIDSIWFINEMLK